ncbi:copper resistance protein CopC [Niallia sp. XMNu-256]|uniref:copper resistance CopC family protein n=1 Tax=Niallia sp. XMNu-256 TaxID=3082444 RepID=UPI0030D44B8D
MPKIIILLLLFIFIVMPANQAIAHTSLQESIPKDGEIVTDSVQELRLIFSTRIEQTSMIRVFNSEGESVTLGNSTIKGNEIRADFNQPLAFGNYDVKWTIVGEDGHPIEGAISFSVEVQMDKTEIEDQDTVDDNQEGPINQLKPEIKQSNLPSYVIPSITGVLFLIVVGSTFGLIRRKN